MPSKSKVKAAEMPEAVRRFGPGAALIAMVLIAFYPALSAGFIWDDDHHVEENTSLHSAGGLVRIWTWPFVNFSAAATPQYYPMTFTSFWLEYRFWDGRPTGYHWTNILLHGINAILLCRVLGVLQVPGAWLAAAIFAVHPVHVESVAWISERKNLLSSFFYALAMLAMLRYFSAPPEGKRRLFYGLALGCFCCAMLSKSVTCSFPAALLLILWWKRGALTRSEILPAIPFFCVGILLALLTVFVERDSIGARGEPWNFSFVDRVLIAGRALWFYASKLLFPANLTFFYPRWEIDASAWWQYLFPLGVLAVVVGLWLARRRLGRGPLVAVLFFAGTLFPALGFFNYFPMLFSFVADHFQYLASIGLITLAATGAASVFVRLGASGRVLGPILGGGILTILGLLTMSQSFAYTTGTTLYEDVIAKNPSAWIAHYNLGLELLKEGMQQKAEEHFVRTLEIYPDFAKNHTDKGAALHLNLGLIRANRQQYDEAAEHFILVTQLDPKDEKAHLNLGITRGLQKRYDEAVNHLEKAIDMMPGYGVAHFEMGRNLMHLQKPGPAVEHLEKAISLMKDYAPAYYELGRAFEKQGKKEESLQAFRRAVELQPYSAQLRLGLSAAL